MARPLITLTTDFGLKDQYVAEMKAVILGICPEASIVDVSHQIEKFNVRMGAFVLAAASAYFPRGTIHVAVVDPGVGTKRRAVCIKTKHACYLGPDNGLLILAAENQGIMHAYEVKNKKLMLPTVSTTFHGRDIFSPVAAHLASGVSLSALGPKADCLVIPEFANVAKCKGMLIGEVIHVDDFGNVVTNIRQGELEKVRGGKPMKLKFKEAGVKLKFCRAYGEVEEGELLALFGSHNFLEISINQGSAASVFNVKSGDEVTVYRS
jgi:S-adenosylmethionine hydrolase